jgi:hypothetical protein
MTTKSQDNDMGFALDRVTCKLGALFIYSSVVLTESLVLRNPPELRDRKCYELARNKKVQIINNRLNGLYNNTL